MQHQRIRQGCANEGELPLLAMPPHLPKEFVPKLAGQPAPEALHQREPGQDQSRHQPIDAILLVAKAHTNTRLL